jgi:hypothetical protein
MITPIKESPTTTSPSDASEVDPTGVLRSAYFFEEKAMATEAGKPNPELNALLEKLIEPFDPSEIKWRVTHTTRDGGRGAVIAFADPRAYSDRLNQIFTPSGWTRTYEVNTVSPVTRMKKDKLIPTGKVLVTCTVTIAGLGTHADNGEEWADEENAMTSAQAQAFKRACTCFGLGRYLYNFAETWVPLNQHRQPVHFPTLPQWALPTSVATAGNSNSGAGPRSTAMQRGPIDQKATAKIEAFRRILGQPIFGEILWRIARARRANAIPNAQVQSEVSDAMERAARGIRKAHSLSEEIGDTQFVSVLDHLHIRSMETIPNLDTLKRLVISLEESAARQAA